MKSIKIGDIIRDYKAKIVYVVGKAELVSGKTVIIGECHATNTDTPTLGYDVIVLNGDGTIPGSEEWGEKAWSWTSFDAALKCMAQINKKTATV